MSSATTPVRMILAKCGLDAHERGVHVIALGLREAGFEVIYLGLRRTPEEIVLAALQEDADVIGISSLSGGHLKFVKRIIEQAGHGVPPLIVVGGLVPERDQQALLEAGVFRIYGAGSLVGDIAADLRDAVAKRRELQRV
jgi:methylmalonyl-CoA mutase, C-terminal domain